MSSSLMSLGAFVLVIVMIPVVLLALRRAGVGGAPAGGVLKPVAQLALGGTQRVAVVEVQVGPHRQWLVLGVTAQQINPLATYTAPDVPPEPAMPSHAVAVNQLIARWRKTPGQGDR